MLFRVVMITVLLGSTLVVNIRAGSGLGHPTTQALLAIIITTYGLTIVYAILLRQLKRLVRFAQIQLLSDVVLTTALVYLTGEAQSVFLFMYSLTVLNAAVLLFRKGALMFAGICSVVVVALVIHRWWVLDGRLPHMKPEQVRSLLETGVVNIAALFVVALLSGYLAEQVRNTGERLQLADADVRHLKALNSLIATSIQSGLIGYDAEARRIFFVNPAAARILDISPGHLMGQHIEHIFPETSGREALTMQPQPGDLVRWEHTHPNADRHQILGCSLSPLIDPEQGRQGYVVVFQDLTDLRKMESTLARSAHLAALGRMAAGMAHELRNPLASMSGSIQMLSERPSLDADDRRLMNIVSRETDRLEGLISDFLQYAGHRPLNGQEIDLTRFLDEVVEMFTHRTSQNDRDPVQVDLDMSAPLRLFADPDALRQIVWNLLNNAAQAMESGGTITISTRTIHNLVEITVADEGPGIAPEALDQLFEPFFTTRQQGTGLGLALVHRLMERHGGDVDVTSGPVGATFILSLPMNGGGELMQSEVIS